VYTETLAREALLSRRRTPAFSFTLSFVLGGEVADLQIYREGKHICGLDLDVRREKRSFRSFSWLWSWRIWWWKWRGSRNWEDVFLVLCHVLQQMEG
jgi:hypothetical protein